MQYVVTSARSPGTANRLQSLALNLTSSRQTVRRLRLDPHVVGPCAAHGPWRGLLLQRSCPPQVCTGLDMALLDEYSGRGVSVVLLGLQSGLQPHRQQLHWGSVQLWPHESPGPAQRGKHQDPRLALLPLPGHVRRNHVCWTMEHPGDLYATM